MNETKTPKREWLTVPEAAERMGISPGRVRTLIRNGLVRAERIGNGKKNKRYLVHWAGLRPAPKVETFWKDWKVVIYTNRADLSGVMEDIQTNYPGIPVDVVRDGSMSATARVVCPGGHGTELIEAHIRQLLLKGVVA